MRQKNNFPDIYVAVPALPLFCFFQHCFPTNNAAVPKATRFALVALVVALERMSNNCLFNVQRFHSRCFRHNVGV